MSISIHKPPVFIAILTVFTLLVVGVTVVPVIKKQLGAQADAQKSKDIDEVNKAVKSYVSFRKKFPKSIQDKEVTNFLPNNVKPRIGDYEFLTQDFGKYSICAVFNTDTSKSGLEARDDDDPYYDSTLDYDSSEFDDYDLVEPRKSTVNTVVHAKGRYCFNYQGDNALLKDLKQDDPTPSKAKFYSAEDVKIIDQINTISVELEYYYEDYRHYPSQADLYDKQWRLDNMDYFDTATIGDFHTKLGKEFTYNATPSSCEKVVGASCSGFTITTKLSGDQLYSSKSEPHATVR